MNRQQAPQPVVRPVREVEDYGDVGEILLQQPVGSDGYRRLLVAIPNSMLKEYVMLLILDDDLTLNAVLAACEINGDNAKFVSANEVSEVTNIMSLPCHEHEEVIEDIANVCRNFLSNLYDAMEWTFDEIVTNERSEISTSMLECRYIG